MAVSRRNREEEKPKVTRTLIVSKDGGTVCTVGSDVVDKYVTGRKAGFELYDEAKHGDGTRETDDETDSDGPEAPPTKPAPVKK